MTSLVTAKGIRAIAFTGNRSYTAVQYLGGRGEVSVLIQKLSPEKLVQAYGIGCQSVYPLKGDVPTTPFGTTYCEIPPNGFTTRHNHHEFETFIILEGRGRMEILGETEEVWPGDVIWIPPHSNHRLDNLSGEGALKFISVYWVGSLFKAPPKNVMTIAAPPTPNGPLHLGHLSGPYLASDVYARFAELFGSNVVNALGTDDNQCYVPAKAKLLGISSEGVVEKFADGIFNALGKFNTKVDYRLQPLGNRQYTEFVQETFRKLVDAGVLVLRETLVPYCEDTKQFIYGAQISGGCPVCKEKTNGNGCEACGSYNSGDDLLNPTSNVGKGPVVLKPASRYFFPMSQYAEKLSSLLQKVAMHPRLREYYDGYLQRGLPDIAVSQFGTWGVECPGLNGQIIFEWFEMAAGYLYIANQVKAKTGGESVWLSKNSEVVETFGFDNSFFYGFLVPALIAEIEPQSKPPSAFLSNFFYQLEGKKFSTSRNHAIWGEEILECVPADPLRYYLAYSRSENTETDFSLAACIAFVETELVGKCDLLLGKFAGLLSTRSESLLAPVIKLTGPAERLISEIQALAGSIHESYSAETFSLNQATRKLNAFLDALILFQERYPKEVSLTVRSFLLWANLVSPLMPDYSKRVRDSLRGGDEKFTVSLQGALSIAGEIPEDYFSSALLRLRQYQGRKNGSV